MLLLWSCCLDPFSCIKVSPPSWNNRNILSHTENPFLVTLTNCFVSLFCAKLKNMFGPLWVKYFDPGSVFDKEIVSVFFWLSEQKQMTKSVWPERYTVRWPFNKQWLHCRKWQFYIAYMVHNWLSSFFSSSFLMYHITTHNVGLGYFMVIK